MTQPTTLMIDHDYAWLIAVPKRQEFTQPQFHFGERVKWSGEEDGQWFCRTGRIIGMRFNYDQQWNYDIQIDLESTESKSDSVTTWVTEADLKLVQDSASIRKQLKPESEWMATQQAAQALGVSPEQLRKLRRRKMFRTGYHYRDTSVPGSGLPRWQWHVARCGKALEVPPEKRAI